MDDTSDPLSSWPIFDVIRTRSVAQEDLYGKLFLYLREVFTVFIRRLRTLAVTFELHCVDAIELPRSLKENEYDRIEVGSSILLYSTDANEA